MLLFSDENPIRAFGTRAPVVFAVDVKISDIKFVVHRLPAGTGSVRTPDPSL